MWGILIDVPLILASASPRRADLLSAAGIACEVRPVDVDERVREGEQGHAYVARVAHLKADAASERWPDAVILAADTAVVVDEAILGKPRDRADAARMLALLSGRSHDVLTGVVVRAPEGMASEVAVTAVTFAVLSADDVAWYVGTGEPMGKAGAYAIQGLASRFVRGVNGSYPNVVGLPVELVVRMLGQVGHPATGTGMLTVAQAEVRPYPDR